MDVLPNEILKNVFKFLPNNDRLKCLSVCRRWYDVGTQLPVHGGLVTNARAVCLSGRRFDRLAFETYGKETYNLIVRHRKWLKVLLLVECPKSFFYRIHTIPFQNPVSIALEYSPYIRHLFPPVDDGHTLWITNEMELKIPVRYTNLKLRNCSARHAHRKVYALTYHPLSPNLETFSARSSVIYLNSLVNVHTLSLSASAIELYTNTKYHFGNLKKFTCGVEGFPYQNMVAPQLHTLEIDVYKIDFDSLVPFLQDQSDSLEIVKINQSHRSKIQTYFLGLSLMHLKIFKLGNTRFAYAEIPIDCELDIYYWRYCNIIWKNDYVKFRYFKNFNWSSGKTRCAC